MDPRMSGSDEFRSTQGYDDPNPEKVTNNQHANKNDVSTLNNQTKKNQPDNKLETEVKKNTISKYFNNQTEKINPIKVSKKDFSSQDEDQFNKILSSTEKNSNRKKYETKQKNNPNPKIYEYSENDSKKFEDLIASGEKVVKSKGKSNFRKNKNNEAYSSSDEELFNKYLSSTEDKTDDQILDGLETKRKEEHLIDQKPNTSESKTFEYNEKDVAQFEKLMSKK